MEETKYLYRLERDFFEWSGLSLRMVRYLIVRETEMTYVIEYRNNEKYVLKGDGRKRFARKTKERALECFIERSKKRLKYLENNIKSENKYLKLAKDCKL